MTDVNVSGIDLSVLAGQLVPAALGQEIPDGQVFWEVTLNGIKLPFSSFYLVLRRDAPDYLRVTCSLTPFVADTVYNHPDGALELKQGVLVKTGGEVSIALSSVVLAGIYESAGAKNQSVNLEGYSISGTVGSAVKELKNLTFRSEGNGVVRFRTIPQVAVLPNDTIIDPETSISYSAHQVIYYATVQKNIVNYFMEVTTG